MSEQPLSEGFNPIFDWLADQQRKVAQLEQENDQLRAQLAAVLAGKDVSVVIAGVPFYLTANAPQNPGVAIHVVPDFAQPTTKDELKGSFLLDRDTGEHEAIFEAEKAAS